MGGVNGGNGFKLLLGEADGLPFVTRRKGVPNYKHDDPFYKKPQSIRKVRVHILNLADKKDYEFYTKIWEAVGYGVVTVVSEEKKFVNSVENWKVFIRWCLNGQMAAEELREIKLGFMDTFYNMSDEHDKRETEHDTQVD